MISELSIKNALRYGNERLAHTEDGPRAAEILLQKVLGVSRTHLYAHSEQILSSQEKSLYEEKLSQRRDGQPIAYLIQQRSFWTLELEVTPATLIPRPETEKLVEIALSFLPHKVHSILDLGTGSGAIALALASECQQWQITACDHSQSALRIAQDNALNLGFSKIKFVLSNWFQEFEKQQFDLIISNPPYLAQSDPHLQQGDLRFEPQTALVSGPSGLEDLHTIIKHGYNHLQKRGMLLLEHGCEQGKAVAELLKQYGYHDIQSWQDWQGLDRISGGRKV